MTFTAITAAAVHAALKAPRAIDQELVQAYITRLAMDYLLGFTLSPVLWTKLPGTKSAGRVQSPALRLICERESARDLFTVEEYYTVEARLAASERERATVRPQAQPRCLHLCAVTQLHTQRPTCAPPRLARLGARARACQCGDDRRLENSAAWE